jgi:hypothetical protein
MTQHYLAGELSLLLGRLQAVATDEASVRDVSQLRREAETGPLATLGAIVVRAFGLADDLCWDSLRRGDSTAFDCQATVGAELRQFALCAGMLEEE